MSNPIYYPNGDMRGWGFPTNWTLLKRLMWVRIMQGGSIPPEYETVTGNPVSFTTVRPYKLRQLSVAFSPVQNLNGYDAPWPAGGGKNKLQLSGRTIVTTGETANTTPRDFSTPSAYIGITANNYFINSNIASYTIADNSITVNSSTSGYGVGLTVKVSPSTQYVLSYKNGQIPNYIGVGFFDADGAYLSYHNVVAASDWTFTTPSNCVNMMVVFRPNTTGTDYLYDTPQLELGSSATSYAPYSNICPISGWDSLNVYHSGADTSNPQTISITIGQTVYSGYVDVLTGVVTVDRVNWELGSKNWTKISGKTGVFVSTFPSPAPASIGIDETADMICSCYKVAKAGDVFGETIPSSIAQGGQGLYNGYWILNDATNAGDIETFLRGQYLCYKLAEPFTIQLTPQEVESLAGDNTMWTDGDSLEVTYRSN